MKNVPDFLTRKMYLLLLLGLTWAGMAHSQITFIVGSGGGATHFMLTHAYNDAKVLAGSFDITIKVQPGTYTNEALTFTPHALTGNHRIRIEGLGGPGAVNYQITSPTPNQVVLLDGVERLSFENLKFTMVGHSARSSWRVLNTRNGAGNCTFKDVIFECPSGPSTFGSGINFPVCLLEDVDDNFTFLACQMLGGSVGVYWNSILPGSHPVVRVIKSDFEEQNQRFAFLNFGVDDGEFHLLDGHLHTSINTDLKGVENLAYDATVWIRKNSFLVENGVHVFGAELRGEQIDVDDNAFDFVDCQEVTGVLVTDHADKIEIRNNHIAEHRNALQSSILSPFRGVVYQPSPQTAGIFTNQLAITQNFVWSNHLAKATGIQAILGGVPLQQELSIIGNHVVFPGIGVQDRTQYLGIAVDGGGAEVATTRVNSNEIEMHMLRASGESNEVLVEATGILLEAMLHSDDFGVFNNDIEIEYLSKDGQGGLRLENILEKPGSGATPVWIGNNMISLNSQQTNSQGLALVDVDFTWVVHNSLHIYDSDSSSSSSGAQSAGIFLGAIVPGVIQGLEVLNNIVLMDAYGVLVDQDCGCALNLNYNLYRTPAHRSNRWRLAGTNYTGLAAWKSATLQESASQVGNPNFLQPPGNPYNDLHIQTVSAAMFNALPITFPAEAFTLRDDFDGDFRENGNPDVGADQITGSGNKTGALLEPTFELERFEPATEWEMFPNPAHDVLHLQGLETGIVRILDLQGRELTARQVQGDATLELDQLPAGLYLIEYTPTLQKPQVRKLVRK